MTEKETTHEVKGRAPGTPTILSVPVHGNKDLKKGTLVGLLKAAGLTEGDL